MGFFFFFSTFVFLEDVWFSNYGFELFFWFFCFVCLYLDLDLDL